MIPSLTREELLKLFATDEEGRFKSLVIPGGEGEGETSFIGKKQLELSLDEVVQIKQYSQILYQNMKRE